ncbi:ComEC/Rec2 family competence protein [Paenibacillus sp. GCM10023252]|uniref:ComEC/Rec2 family competence protein n=1 Tax=Paenibacillus sp. GCM10023252 TaxID=3252649 RepID=UPI003615CA46
MNRRPLVWFTVYYVAGSASAAALNREGMLLACGSGMLLLLAWALAGRVTGRLAAVCAAALLLAACERAWVDARNVTAMPDLLAAAEAEGAAAAIEVEAAGTIMSAVDVDGDRAEFSMTADTVRVQGEPSTRELRERLLVQVRLAEQPHQSIAAGWQRGDRVVVAGKLARPAGASNSCGFDYRRYLRSQGTHWLLKATGIGAVEAAPGPPWTAAALLGRVDQARARLGAGMDELYPAAEQAGYMKGLVLGIREDLDPVQFSQFSRLGLTHILAISGLHVAVFLYVLGSALRLLRFTRERLLLVLIAAVPFYVLLSGLTPSVVRAGIMAMLGLLAARMHMLKDGLHILAAAALLMLVWDPYYLEDVSFQLSFIVTGGLIIGVPPIRRAMPSWRRGKWALDLGAVTLTAQLFSFPVTIYYFNQFHLLSLPANFVLVPFISFVVMPLGAAALLLGEIWEPAGVLLAAAGMYANDWTFKAIDWLSHADKLRSIWRTPSLWWMVGWYGLLGTVLALLRRRQSSLDAAVDADDTLPLNSDGSGYTQPGSVGNSEASRYNKALAAAGLAALLLLAYAYYPDFADRTGRVSVLDVGQGDAIYIRTPGLRSILVDGGGTLSFRKPGEEWKERRDPYEVGRKVIVPLLMKRGVHQLDVLVITHLDSDHIRGLTAVLQSIPVKEIWWNGTIKRSDDAEALLRLAASMSIPMYGVHAGQTWEPERHAAVRILWPPPKAASSESTVRELEEQNEESVVLELAMYGRTFLFSGDINSVTETAVLGQLEDHPALAYPPDTDGIDMLKVAHHGSRFSTSEAWLSRLRPASAVISAGASNTYGHPHPDVLRKLSEYGSHSFRTDKQGEIAYRVTRHTLLVKGFKDNR